MVDKLEKVEPHVVQKDLEDLGVETETALKIIKILKSGTLDDVKAELAADDEYVKVAAVPPPPPPLTPHPHVWCRDCLAAKINAFFPGPQGGRTTAPGAAAARAHWSATGGRRRHGQ